MDMLSGNINKTEVMYPMPKIVLDVDDVRRALGKVKKGKLPGPDKLKGEIYKTLKDNEKLVIHLTKANNAVLEDGTVPEKWKRSRTVMIPKTRKPTAKEHRPIALTNVGYKLFMRLVKDKLVQHLDRNGMISDYQAGFTGGRRLEENLFIVRYCIEDRLGRELVVVSIDFEQAFDRVERVALARALKS